MKLKNQKLKTLTVMGVRESIPVGCRRSDTEDDGRSDADDDGSARVRGVRE